MSISAKWTGYRPVRVSWRFQTPLTLRVCSTCITKGGICQRLICGQFRTIITMVSSVTARTQVASSHLFPGIAKLVEGDVVMIPIQSASAGSNSKPGLMTRQSLPAGNGVARLHSTTPGKVADDKFGYCKYWNIPLNSRG
jgi:hypothetical protein